ncbi:MAG: YihY/virulence factor BrkB family protein [Actinobacteria bacterium]|nr:YihY/virulence factor BrkB family protein [Actinomycetota bacterium]
MTRFPWAVIQTFSDGQGALLSGSMAYFTFLSLLPLLMIAGFAVGAVSNGDPGVQAALVTAVDRIFPGISGEEILAQLIRARVAFGIVGLVTVSYAASGFVGAMTASLNRMWEVPRGRNPVGQKALNFLVVGLLGVVLLASVGVTIWAAYWSRRALGSDARVVIHGIDFVAGPLSFFFVLLLLYRMLPARSLSWRSQAPGALFGAVVIELLKRGFAFWADHSAGVAVLPRSLVSVVLLLVWLGFLGQAILYGAALNVVADRRRRGANLFPPTAIDDSDPKP